MKFKLSTVGYWYDEEDKIKLEKFGFKFDESTKVGLWEINEYKPTIEISTLEELMELANYSHLLISEKNEIEFYDDYKE
jgi:hypothetical protein